MSPYVPVELQRQVRDRFRGCCAYCLTAETLTAMTFELEHIVPRSAGGETTFENLCFACPFCNRHKADRQMVIDPDTNQPVEFFHPQRQTWIDHFTWSEDSTEVVGLSAVGRATIVALKMNRPELVRVRKLWIKLKEHPPQLG